MTHPPYHHRGPPPWTNSTSGVPQSPPVTNGWGRYVSGAISSLQAQVDNHHETHQQTRETLKENREILTEHSRLLHDIHGHVIKLQTILDMDREDEKNKPEKTNWAERKDFEGSYDGHPVDHRDASRIGIPVRVDRPRTDQNRIRASNQPKRRRECALSRFVALVRLVRLNRGRRLSWAFLLVPIVLIMLDIRIH